MWNNSAWTCSNRHRRHTLWAVLVFYGMRIKPQKISSFEARSTFIVFAPRSLCWNSTKRASCFKTTRFGCQNPHTRSRVNILSFSKRLIGFPPKRYLPLKTRPFAPKTSSFLEIWESRRLGVVDAQGHFVPWPGKSRVEKNVSRNHGLAQMSWNILIIWQNFYCFFGDEFMRVPSFHNFCFILVLWNQSALWT